MEYTGAEIVVKCLQEEHVEHVFGYPGGAVLFIYDEIFKQKDFQPTSNKAFDDNSGVDCIEPNKRSLL